MEEGSEVLSASLDAEMARHSLRIRDAFDLFDPGHTGYYLMPNALPSCLCILLMKSTQIDMIAKKEVPSAIRYLNVFPKERELVIGTALCLTLS